MRINIVAFDNGVGNSRDVALLREAVIAAGHEASVTAIGRQQRRLRRSPVLRTVSTLRRRLDGTRARFDCNLMLEHVWPSALKLAHRNVVVPNPEWFDRADLAALALVDEVWTKTQYAQQIFSARMPRCTHIGFDSVDRYSAHVPRTTQFLHLAGKSRMKGTARLLEVWRQHAGWPTLSVIYSRAGVFEAVLAANIRYIDEYLSDEQLRELQNAHRFHVCTSETEGWGHYIPEALSIGAIALTTDAPPMNELVTAERGLMIASTASSQQHLARLYDFSTSDLERQVRQALLLSDSDLERLSTAAQVWFAANRQKFRQRVALALGG